MESRKTINNVNVGGDLNSAAADAMQQAGINQQKPSIPADAVLVNNCMLPSKGICYDGAQVYVSPLTSKNLKDLNTMREETANATLNNVLAERIHGIDFHKILQGDKIWLMFMIRAVTYDDYPIFIKYNCPDCKHAGVYQMRINDVPVNHVKDDFDFKLKLPKSGDILTLRYPDISNETKAERVKSDTQIIEAVDPELVDVGTYIAEVNGNKLTTMESYKYVKNMNALDFTTFSNFMIENNIGVNPTTDIVCDCGKIIQKRIGFTPDFFMPKFNQKIA